jgi:hypothetical protein
LQGFNLSDSPDVRLLKLTGWPYKTRDAYAALDSAGDSTDTHGRRIWVTRLPNKVKVFAWLYFKNRLSTRVNLHAKNIVDGDQCQRCSGHSEDRHHVFFSCRDSLSIWARIGMADVRLMTDNEAWDANTPAGLDTAL